jgi:D-alanine-D-alanine ligase
MWENDSKMHLMQNKKWLFSKKNEIILDACFHVFHWLAWEDWSIQWLCELLEVPYVWPGILWWATTLDKIITKDILKANNLPIVPYITFEKWKWDIKKIESTLNYPMFVKPYNLWSSIWISKVKNTKELQDAIEVAEHFSNDIIIEEWVNNLIELNCAVYENNSHIITSLVEQPISWTDFLSFDEKYIISWDGGWTMTWNKKKVNIPALIPDEVTNKVQDMAKSIFKIFRLWWAPRIDFLYDEKENKLYVNEINPIPWAMQIHLWEKSWLTQTEFLKNLIESAFAQNERRKVNIDFKSNILDHTISFMK